MHRPESNSGRNYRNEVSRCNDFPLQVIWGMGTPRLQGQIPYQNEVLKNQHQGICIFLVRTHMLIQDVVLPIAINHHHQGFVGRSGLRFQGIIDRN